MNPESDESKSIITSRQKAILCHSTNRVPFYLKHLTNSKDLSLEDFPIINKNIIRDNIDEFISEGVNKSTLYRVVTSGSTGTPFSVYHDKKKRKK
jgi:phenylacetate-CoA ligase